MNLRSSSTLAASLLAIMPATLALFDARTAAAQPAKDGTADGKSGEKQDAKALMASGVKLFGAKDYLGALAVFQNAYARFPSAKILLNIATTLSKLGRTADAANAYQRYLDASDSDPAKRAEVTSVLAELDRSVGVVEITVTPADAELKIDDAWVPAATLQRVRVAPGDLLVHARKPGFDEGSQVAHATAGATARVAITLTATPVAVATTVEPTDTGVHATLEPAAAPSQFGVLALGHFDLSHHGGAALLGVTADLTTGLQVQAAALIGSTSGGYLGARFAFLDGTLRPLIAAGLPMFASNGIRFAVRGAAGVEVELTRHLALIAEVGIERMLNAEAGVIKTLFVPAIGAVGRL